MDLFDEPLTQGTPLYFGVLGKTDTLTKQKLSEEILHPLLSLWSRLPDKVLLPSEGTSSALISIWAEQNNVEFQSFDANYQKLGRKAGFLRDAMITKEATHLLVFLGTRSQKNEQIAIREVKKGKHVYTVDPKTFDLTEYTTD
jgi:hypothetical protein